LGDPKARLALEVIATLNKAGFTAFLAGGCVRDALLDLVPKDYDVASDARPEQIRKLFGFRRTLAIGAAFGVICVCGDGRNNEPGVEVATFRADGEYSDGRRPDDVVFSSPEADAMRRDFTINGLFFDPQRAEVIDYIGGVADLQKGVIRAIGDPVARFAEDKLRLLRAVRFATRYQFELEANTLLAVQRHAQDVVVCSGERIGAEMRRILTSSAAAQGIDLLCRSRLASPIMPRIAAGLSDSNRLAQLRQRLARSGTDELGHRLAMLALVTDSSPYTAIEELVQSWRLTNAERDAATAALASYPALLDAHNLPWSKLQPLLIQRHATAAVALSRALAAEQEQGELALAHIDQALRLPPTELDPPPFIGGDELVQLGYQPGPHFRTLIAQVRAAQLDGKIVSKVQAIAYVQKMRPQI
jgi:tRNA nucleotidyltransferase (CCA-adding enzyme)